ncbi:MAG: thiL2 [Firmicutes bacterium]|nr:thiL2 [Bacillota bacterium]MBP2629645.1 thiL2 [Bacillota bacterium]
MNKDETRAFYDEMAEKMAKDWYENDILNPSLIEFIGLLKNKKPRILDLGCGTGHESMRMAKLGADVLGIDFSKENIKLANQMFKGGQFKLMDFRNIDSNIGMFDGVFACAALVHVSSTELPDLLKRIANILNDNGYLGIIIREGTGIDKEWSKVKLDEKEFIRPFYLHEKNGIDKILAEQNVFFSKEGYLADDFIKYKWRFFIYHKQDGLSQKDI